MSAEIERLERQLAALQRGSGPDHTSEQRGEFLTAQARADSLMRGFGSTTGAPPPVAGEQLIDYKARLLKPLQETCVPLRRADLTRVRDPSAFKAIEERIYQDAERVLHDGSTVPAGQMRTIIRQDATGMNRFKEYVGKPNACWDKFKLPRRFVKRFGTQDCF